MAQTVSASSNFVYLVENIPEWEEIVDTQVARTLTKNDEFKADHLRIVKQSKPRRMKPPSIASLHTRNELEQPASQAIPSGHESTFFQVDNELASI